MRWFALPLLLVACSQPVPPAREVMPVPQPEPQVTMHVVEGSQLLVMQVFTRDEFGLGETQKCFLWRDHEFKTATMNCPVAPTTPALIP